MTTGSESRESAEQEDEFDLDDPEVRAEVRVIFKALIRLIEHSRHKAKRSRSFQEGLAVFEKKTAPRRARRIH